MLKLCQEKKYKLQAGKTRKGFWLTALVVLVLVNCIHAEEKSSQDANKPPEVKLAPATKDANDSSESWWRRWDAVVKNADDPNEIVSAKLNAIITVLQSKELTQESKEKIIDKIISPFFDFELMSKLVLGKTHWTKLMAAEQKKFTELFTTRLKNSYLEKITLDKDEKVELKPAVPVKANIQIAMDVLSNGNKVAVLYKLRKAGSQWKIYDVEIQGVSILLTYRSQFDDIFSRGGVQDLFAQLEKSGAK